MREYLKSLNINKEDIPYYYCPNDKREEHWTKQREKYGFDERETWSLDTTFFIWLYERLSMYNEVNCVDTEADKYEINGETQTFQHWIDKMLENCKFVIEHDWMDEGYNSKSKELLLIFSNIIGALWW